MCETKEQVSKAILRAKADLDLALGTLEKIPSFDASSVALSAHALNNFLTVTTAVVDLLKLSLEDYPNPEVQKWLGNLKHSNRLMSHIVAELMNDATLRKHPELKFEAFDLARMARRACTYYQQVADPKELTINLTTSGNEASAWGDPVAVAAIMDNLLSNAVKYSIPGKEIQVRVSREPGSVICSVQDGGPGLSVEDQSRLFQVGVKLSSVPTGDESSSGYGLAVARELIDGLGGKIWCDSQPGEGALFSFSLPVKSPDET
jgi:signal transduction histidine kinase